MPQKSLDQMQIESLLAEKGKGQYECPRCGCKEWRGENNSEVQATRQPDGSQITVRVRICRHCGQTRFVTQEVVVPDGHQIKIVPKE